MDIIKKEYRIKWKSCNSTEEIFVIRIFSDIQWKDYGVRATDDITGETFIIPYFSIYDVEVLKTEV